MIVEDIKKAPADHLAKRSYRPLIIGVPIISILLLALLGGWFYAHSIKSPVPKKISQAVDFPIYYPEPKKLPIGYALNINSFRTPEKDVVLYSVNYDGNKKIIFSVQKQPSDDEIKGFYTNYIPLRNQMQTDLGKAEIGAYGPDKDLKTVVSLPTNKGTWLIITTPYDINQDQLKQLLNSLRK